MLTPSERQRLLIAENRALALQRRLDGLRLRTTAAAEAARLADAELYRRRRDDGTPAFDPPPDTITLAVTFDGYSVLDDTYEEVTLSQSRQLDATVSGDWWISDDVVRIVTFPQTSSTKIVRWRDDGGTGNAPWFKELRARVWYNTVTEEWKLFWRLNDALRNPSGFAWTADAFFSMERVDANTVETVSPLDRIAADDSLVTNAPATYTLASEAGFYRHPSTTSATLVSHANQMGLVSASVTW